VLRYFDRIIQDQRIYALGYCDRGGRIAYATAAFPKDIRCSTSKGNEEKNWVLQRPEGRCTSRRTASWRPTAAATASSSSWTT
jgi:hypothetical protein